MVVAEVSGDLGALKPAYSSADVVKEVETIDGRRVLPAFAFTPK